MISPGKTLLSATMLLTCLGLKPAAAQIPVTDIGAIVQLVSQLQALEQQVETARQQLQQAQSEFQAITGSRGMERLLSGTVRNYLPATWDGTRSMLASAISAAANANAVLSDTELAELSPMDRQLLQAGRQSTALRQVLAQQALATTSNRFASLQQLIDAIPVAADQKGALDLLARITAEQGMLQNEQTKLQLVARASAADEAVSRQRATEQAIAARGQFANRFQPTP